MTAHKPNRQDDILDAAADLFASRAFHEVRLDDIAARAHISKGTVYLYWSSKEEVYLAVIRRGFAAVLDRLFAESAVAPPSSWGATGAGCPCAYAGDAVTNSAARQVLAKAPWSRCIDPPSRREHSNPRKEHTERLQIGDVAREYDIAAPRRARHHDRVDDRRTRDAGDGLSGELGARVREWFDDDRGEDPIGA